MDGKILFLGTAGETDVWRTSQRRSGGIIIQFDDQQILIDPGLGCIEKLHSCKLDASSTTAILVSHAHLNHCNDVNAVLASAYLSGTSLLISRILPSIPLPGQDTLHYNL